MAGLVVSQIDPEKTAFLLSNHHTEFRLETQEQPTKRDLRSCHNSVHAYQLLTSLITTAPHLRVHVLENHYTSLQQAKLLLEQGIIYSTTGQLSSRTK